MTIDARGGAQATQEDLFDLLPDAVVACDAERRTVLWNRAAEDMYGFTRGEALGRRAAEMLETRFPIPPAEILEIFADTGHWEGDLVQRTKDGRELIVESRWVARRDDHGALAGVLSVDRDVTARVEDHIERERGEASAERVRLHSRLHRVQRLESIGQLAGGIAHDFNNVLAIIINYTALIVGELDSMPAAPSREYWSVMRADLGEIETAAERAARLTHQLLSFSRSDAGNPVAMDLNESVRRVEEMIRRTIGEHIELVPELDDDLEMIRADPGQLEQALVNLSVNSRDAMPEGGRLTIDTANVDVDDEYAAERPDLSPGRYVRLRVSDTGTGMAPEVIEQAFDPFFTTKALGHGTGLGLATVHGAVRQAGGRAQFDSEPEVGTTFIALFPAVGKVAVAMPALAPMSASPEVRTILLVEDEAALRAVTLRILQKAGYDVIAAPTGARALELAGSHAAPIDLLLSDVVMPAMLGHQLAARLRELRPAIRVLFMSGFAGPVLDDTEALAGTALIEKPFTALELLDRIASAPPPE